MNAFVATVSIKGLSADYQVFFICKKFKAILQQKHLAEFIPYQLDFWKDNGIWKSYHPLDQDVINQFGNTIEDELRNQAMKTHQKRSAIG